MSPASSGTAALLRGAPLGLLLGGALALFSLGTPLPWYAGFAIAFGSAVLATWVRVRLTDSARELAVVMLLAVLVLFAAIASATPGAIVLGGSSTLVLLLWLADDPREVPGGARRAAPAVLLAAFVVAVAWGSALLLPSRNAVVGIAAGLFVFSIVVLAVFFGRPDVLDRNRSANP